MCWGHLKQQLPGTQPQRHPGDLRGPNGDTHTASSPVATVRWGQPPPAPRGQGGVELGEAGQGPWLPAFQSGLHGPRHWGSGSSSVPPVNWSTSGQVIANMVSLAEPGGSAWGTGQERGGRPCSPPLSHRQQPAGRALLVALTRRGGCVLLGTLHGHRPHAGLPVLQEGRHWLQGEGCGQCLGSPAGGFHSGLSSVGGGVQHCPGGPSVLPGSPPPDLLQPRPLPPPVHGPQRLPSVLASSRME